MQQDLRISVTFTSDWHIGAGAGQPGHIDRLVRRDPVDGLPYVPAKTLTGMLRDSCEAIANAMDEDDGDDRKGHAWQTLLLHIFGDQPAKSRAASWAQPLQAALSVGPATLPQPFREQIRVSSGLRRVLTIVKPGVRIDRTTGQAQTEHLRMVEVVRGGTALASEATLSLDRRFDEWRRPALALLWAGARTIERIGGQRRRGLGRCKVALAPTTGAFSQADIEAFKAVLSDSSDGWLTTGGSTTSGARIQPASASQSRSRAWTTISLELNIQRPVVVPEQVVGNAVSCLDYIPGTYLVAHVLRALSGVLGRSAFPLLASGDVRVLNGYLKINDTRGRPVPLSYRYAKALGGLDSGRSAWNILSEEWPEGSGQAKPHRTGYLAPSDGSHLTLDRPKFVETTHATINDDQQRPIEDEVGVFSYKALRPGTCLCSEIHIASAVAKELSELDSNWPARLKGTARIGVAKKDDYGKIGITARSADPRPAPVLGEHLTVWLLSDLLLRDHSLRASTDVDVLRTTLEDELNRDRNDTMRLTLEIDKVHTRVRRSDGWQTIWQLPKPTLVGLQAGSVVRFTIGGAPPSDIGDRFNRLQGAGIGERRGEGFGEIVLDDPLASAGIAHLSGRRNSSTQGQLPRSQVFPPDVADADPANSVEYVALLEREAWRATYREQVTVWASNSEARRGYLHWSKEQPSNSQLGTLRQLATIFRGPSPLVAAWLLAQGKRKKWAEESLDVVERLTRSEDEAWKSILIAIEAAAPVTINVGRTAAFRRELWPEAARLFLLVAIRHEIRDREPRSSSARTPPVGGGAGDARAEGAVP